ncbi:MAG: nucleotidyltransferase domain-containing protein [bacterium]
MASLNEIQEYLKNLCSKYEIEIIYSFGSRAKEVKDFLDGSIAQLDEGGSDVDIGIKLKPGSSLSVREKVLLSLEIEAILGVERIDLCLVNEVDPFLAAEIIRGERVFCCDEYLADQYDLYILRRAGDLEPLERDRSRLVLGEPEVSP